MPRTPLFRALTRARLVAQGALRSDRPAPEILEEWTDRPQVSRRRFLAASATAAAGLGVAACRSLPVRPGAPSDVLIIGAGIAGLTAGYRLSQGGLTVRILEAQNRVGGRMHSLRGHFADEQVAELGGELIDTPHAHIQALVKELRLELDDLAETGPDAPKDTWFFEGRSYTEAELSAAFVPVAQRIEADLEKEEEAALDALSIAEWLDQAGVSGWFRRVLDVGYTTEFGLPIDEQSALNLLEMIDTNAEPFRIFGESDERYHVRGGNDRIVSALGDLLGDRVETGVRLEAITQAADGSLRCDVRRGSRSETLAASHVIVAIPFTLLREVKIDVEMPEEKRRAIRELGYGTNAKLMIGFGERFWRGRGANGSVLTDLPFQLTWDTSRAQPGRAGILTNFTGGTQGLEVGTGSAAQQAALVVRDLERVFPGAARHREKMKEARFHWPTHPFTRGSYACYRPGQTVLRDTIGLPAGALHFAGEHCSVEAQGFMEGGCETGEAAAKAILAAQRRVALRAIV